MSIRQNLHTIKHLKVKQLIYQVVVLLRKKLGRDRKMVIVSPKQTTIICFAKPLIFKHEIYSKNTFTFLNISQHFKDEIDWSYSEYGMLWTYNLNYMDFLNQKSMTKELGLELIHSFIKAFPTNKINLDPYPTSLRGINWVKFLSRCNESNALINTHLFSQYKRLSKKIEYHLLGNHLLENGFSLLFGAVYFQDPKLWNLGKKIVLEELDEQILLDGGHFELSPMYHQIILDRLLDCINLLQNNIVFNDQNMLLECLRKDALKMLEWLNGISFKNNEIPLFNDAAFEIAPSTNQLNVYAETLKLKLYKGKLGESGYRKYDIGSFECVIDGGKIGSDYQPGHAHSDVGSFIVYHNLKPFIVEAGTSTYEDNIQRKYERSIEAHNCVQYSKIDACEMYGAFRVGNRPEKVELIKETPNTLCVRHDGYKKLGVFIQRSFTFCTNEIEIIDEVFSESEVISISRIHFKPGLIPKVDRIKVQVEDVIFNFEGCEEIRVSDYTFAAGFNKLVNAKVLEVKFYKKVITRIRFPE